jgi:hypothetical protein
MRNKRCASYVFVSDRPFICLAFFFLFFSVAKLALYDASTLLLIVTLLPCIQLSKQQNQQKSQSGSNSKDTEDDIEHDQEETTKEENTEEEKNKDESLQKQDDSKESSETPKEESQNAGEGNPNDDSKSKAKTMQTEDIPQDGQQNVPPQKMAPENERKHIMDKFRKRLQMKLPDEEDDPAKDQEGDIEDEPSKDVNPKPDMDKGLFEFEDQDKPDEGMDEMHTLAPVESGDMQDQQLDVNHDVADEEPKDDENEADDDDREMSAASKSISQTKKDEKEDRNVEDTKDEDVASPSLGDSRVVFQQADSTDFIPKRDPVQKDKDIRDMEQLVEMREKMAEDRYLIYGTSSSEEERRAFAYNAWYQKVCTQV